MTVSLVLTLHDLTGAFAFVEAAPLYTYGFSWLPWALAGAVVGALLGRRFDRRSLPSGARAVAEK